MHCHPVSVGIQLPDTEHIDSSLVCLSKISLFFLKPDIWHLTLMGRELGSQPPLLAPGAHHFHHDPFRENGCPVFNTGEWGTQLWDPCKSCHRKAKCLCDYLYQQDPGFCPPYLIHSRGNMLGHTQVSYCFHYNLFSHHFEPLRNVNKL